MRLRDVLLWLGIAGLALVVFLNRSDLDTFLRLVRHLRWYVVLLVVAVQLLSYYLNALYYRSILHVLGFSMNAQRLFEGALASNFVNYVFPTAGMAGAGYLSQVLSPEVPRGEGVLCQILRYAFSGLAVLIMIPVGILWIVLSRKTSGHLIVTAIVSSVFIVALAALVVLLVSREALLRRTLHRLEKYIRKLVKGANTDKIDELVDEFYKGYRALGRKKRSLLVPFYWSIGYIVVEIGTLYLSFVAFGRYVNPGIVIMAYLLANIASLVGGSIVSTGVFELGMLGTLVTLGITFAVALPITIAYRVLNLLIGLPPGFYFYRKYLPR